MTTLNIRPINQVKIITSSKFTIYNVVSYETQGLGLIRIPLSDLVLIWDQVSYETLSFMQNQASSPIWDPTTQHNGFLAPPKKAPKAQCVYSVHTNDRPLREDRLDFNINLRIYSLPKYYHPRSWNKISNSLKAETTTKVFKSNLKALLIESYANTPNCTPPCYICKT